MVKINSTSLILTLTFFSYSTFSFAIPAESQKIMISGPNRIAVEVGLKIARKGGNLVDVAVGTAIALSVTSPYHASLGGGGLALIKMNGKVDALDFREVAPLHTNQQSFIDKESEASETGGLAVAVPGIPAGLQALHKKYGKIQWSVLFDEPIKIAEDGFEVTRQWSQNTSDESPRFNKAARAQFMGPNEKPLLPGDHLKQKKLASLLKEMRNRGAIAFYSGPCASDIVSTVEEAGGVLTLEDLRNYKVRWLDPLVRPFSGYTVYLMPPPSSGGVVISTALALTEKLKLSSKEPLSVDELHLIAEILQASFRSRTLLGDPDFTINPISKLISPKFIDELASKISATKHQRMAPFTTEELKKVVPESSETTNISVLDQAGNAIAMTITLNGNYGSGLATKKFGVTLNNEMDDFTTRLNQPNQFGLIQGAANTVEPGKRPLSSMSPTLVEKNGETVLALGSPGGPRIISAVFQVLYRVLVSDYDMDDAIQAPRVHHQVLPDILYVDPKRLPPETIASLKQRDFKIEESKVALVYGVRKNKNGRLEGAFDSRGEGAALGF